MKTWIVVAWAVMLFLLATVTGCGGGSLGTGVRTLQGEKIKEGQKPAFERPTIWTPSCTLKVGFDEITTELASEFGSGAVLAKSAPGCAFLLPEQAQSIRFTLSNFPRHAEPVLTLMEASCFDGRDISGTERSLRYDPRGTILPVPHWKDGRYLKILIRLGEVDQAEVQLLDDGFESCPVVAPEDGKD